jgi:hypothetical protein
MKNLILILTITINTYVYASLEKAGQIFIQDSLTSKDQISIIKKLYNKKLYFSSAHFARRYLIHTEQPHKDLDQILEKLVLRTGTTAFIDLPHNILKRNNYKTLAFIAGLKLFSEKKYKETITRLDQIKENHRFTPEALMITGTSHSLINKFPTALKRYDECIKSANEFETQAKDKKLKRYYAIIAESCVIEKARVAYKNGDFALAQASYRKIPTKSYRWPYIILEQAWSAYANEDYNRSLGLLVTYKSPLLKSYFMPEGATLRSLNYFRLCLWSDSLQVINEYYQTYKAKSDALKSIILPHKHSDNYFINLVNRSSSKNDNLNPFIRNLTTQTKKTIKYNIDLVNYKALVSEKKRIKNYYKQKKSKLLRYLHKRLGKEKKWRIKKLNHFVKKQMFGFLNQMHKNSFEMVSIKLEILFRQRDLLYQNKTVNKDRKRGSLDNVKRSANQHFYTFRGSFWADELGDYSFGLKSQCEVQKQ